MTRLLVTLTNGVELVSRLPVHLDEEELLDDLRQNRPLIIRGRDGERTIVPVTAILHIRPAE